MQKIVGTLTFQDNTSQFQESIAKDFTLKRRKGRILGCLRRAFNEI